MKTINLKSFCKVNLTLNVLKKLNNRYHKIESLITFCTIYDNITISKSKNQKDKVIFSGNFKGGISSKKNTITKLLDILRKKNYIREKNFTINIKKNIPHGSGLGGGSANAAVLLNFFNHKFNLNIKNKTLHEIATQIGSDVPISLQKKNTLVNNKGKILRLNKIFKLNMLIVYPNIVCPTKKIYENNKKYSLIKKQPNFSNFSKKKLISYLIDNNNDLEVVTIKLYPRIKKIIDFIKSQNGCYFSRITGSGSACIGIFNDMKSAIYTKKLIRFKFPKYWSVTSKTI